MGLYNAGLNCIAQLVAGNDINLLDARNTTHASGSQTTEDSGFLSKTKTLTTWDSKSSTGTGTTVSGVAGEFSLLSDRNRG